MSAHLQFRRDLICCRLQAGNRIIWVLKEPFCRDHHYVGNDEFTILGFADGCRSVEDLHRHCVIHFPSRVITSEGLVRFLADAKRKRLLLGPTTAKALNVTPTEERYDPRKRRPWWHNPLAIRCPGVNPDRWLDCLPNFSFGTSCLATAYFVVVAIAATLAMVYSSELVREPGWNLVAVADNHWTTLIVVVVGAKIIHELAHAIACRRLGGHCREIGVMLLLGVPCLYCDVSSAWMLPSRFHRIFVSAAGMIAEFGLAALAMILWAMTSDDDVRAVWVVIIAVCSISTVVVNGNPLLRYDGYFMLCDGIGVPNLAGKSTLALKQLVRRVIWNEPLSFVDNETVAGNLWLAAYAIASGLYRFMVIIAIAALIYQFAGGHGISLLGVTVAMLLVVSSLYSGLRSILVPPSAAFRRNTPNRRWLPPLVAAAVIALGMLVPLPRTVVQPMTIAAIESQSVFALRGGRIHCLVKAGDEVMPGDTIAILQNDELQQQRLHSELRYQLLESQSATLATLRTSQVNQSATMIATQAAATAARQRLRLAEEEVSALKLVTPRAGVVYRPTHREATPHDDDSAMWSGTPLDNVNDGAWIEPGTCVCIVGDDSNREAIVYAAQQDVSLVEIGQTVQLLIPRQNGNVVTGQVVDVSATPVQHCAIELLQAGLIASDPKQPAMSRQWLHQVRVVLSESADGLPIRTIGQAKIQVNSASIASRIVRAMLQSFHW